MDGEQTRKEIVSGFYDRADEDGRPAGFAQCQLRRDYVEGTKSSQVGYPEGVYVAEGFRRRGFAAELLAACEDWAKEKGCAEFAADCELDNAESLRFHPAMGFEEANRIICLKKSFKRAIKETLMKHHGTKTIETERLLLRAFEPSDAAAAFRNWTSDEKVTEFLRWPTHGDISVTERVVADWVSRSAEPDFYQWAIVLKELGEPVGTISVVDKNERLGILHVGYCVGSRWWRRGITTEAFRAIIPYLFGEVGANRIESWHDPENPHSGAVMRKCGLRYEGTLRQADFSNRGVVDACVYGLLRSEWQEDPARPGEQRNDNGF